MSTLTWFVIGVAMGSWVYKGLLECVQSANKRRNG